MSSPLRRTKRVTRRVLPAFKMKALKSFQKIARKTMAKRIVARMGNPNNIVRQQLMKSGRWGGFPTRYRTRNPYTVYTRNPATNRRRLVVHPRQLALANALQKAGFYKRVRQIPVHVKTQRRLARLADYAKKGMITKNSNIGANLRMPF